MSSKPLRASVLNYTFAFVILPAAIACGSEDGQAGPGPGTATDATGNGTTVTSTNSATPAVSGSGSSTRGSVSDAVTSGGGSAGTENTPASSGGSSTGGGNSTAGGSTAETSDGGSGGASGGTSDSTTNSGQPGTCAAADMLQQYAPADEELAEEFAEYLATEVGTLDCQTSGQGGSRTITQTILIPPNVVYDGKGESLTADAAAMNCDTSPGEQAESQRPYFLLAPGASVLNVTINYPGCEGIHMMGDNVLENITWPDVGEDAASVRSYFPGGDITIRGGEAHHASDKIFQFNAPCNLLIQDFTGSDMGKLVRQNGGTEFEFYVDLNNVSVTDVISAVVQSDSPLCFVRHHNLSYTFTGSGDKSDRVFRDIPPENVTEY